VQESKSFKKKEKESKQAKKGAKKRERKSRELFLANFHLEKKKEKKFAGCYY